MSGQPGTGNHGFIDVNAAVGPAHGRAGGATPEALSSERRSHGVRLSLVHHRSAVMADPDLGNREMLDIVAQDPGLVPVGVLLPDRTDRLERRAAELGPRVAAFWLEGRATPTGATEAATTIARAAARTGRPLFVRIGGWGDASAIGAATQHLGVPVVLVGAHYDHAVDDIAAAKRYPHLHLETSSLAHLGAISTVVRAIGAERLLWGTGAPLRATQSSLNAVLQASIPDDAKRAILGGNAARLFDLPGAPIELPPVWRPDRAFDVHSHSGPLFWDVANLDDSEMLPLLDAQVNGKGAVSSSILAIAADSEAGNRRTVENSARNSKQLGFLVADPNGLESTREQIRRWGDAPGIVGAKIHCQWSGQPTGSKAIWELFRVLGEWGRPVKIHNDGPDWDDALLRIAREYPRMPIIIAHGGLGFPSMEGAAVSAAADHVYYEMCSSFAQIPTVREVIKVVPRERFMFGTDTPLLDPGFVLGTYQDAGFPEVDQSRVFWDNAAALFGLS